MFFSESTRGFYVLAIHGDNIPSDAVEITDEQHVALLYGQSIGKVISADADGYPVLLDSPPPTKKQIIAGFTTEIQVHLDDFAKTRGYDDILSACTYATSAVTKFSTEGQYCVNARDDTWSSAYTILADVEAGDRVMPTIDEVMLELPVLEWPST